MSNLQIYALTYEKPRMDFDGKSVTYSIRRQI